MLFRRRLRRMRLLVLIASGLLVVLLLVRGKPSATYAAVVTVATAMLGGAIGYVASEVLVVKRNGGKVRPVGA